MAEFLHRAIEEMGVRRVADRPCHRRQFATLLQLQVEGIERFPHLAGDLVTQGARQFACSRNRNHDRALILGIEGEIEGNSVVVRFAVARGEEGRITRNLHQRFPLMPPPLRLQFRYPHPERVVIGNIGNPRRILGPLHIPPDPIQRFRNPA